MRRGTTPPITVSVNENLTGYTLYVTVKNGFHKATLTGDRLTINYTENSTVIAFMLTQEETLAFGVGRCEVQVRAVDARGYAVATDIKTKSIGRIIQEGVIHV